MDSKVLGILGGGQLGRMTVEAANRLNIHTRILDADGSPAKQINAVDAHVKGNFNDYEKVRELAHNSDVLTIEIEHVNTNAMQDLSIPVVPRPATIQLIQDKFVQKEHLAKYGVAVATSEAVEATQSSLEAFGGKYGFPFMLKTRRDAYDGRGNAVVGSASEIPAALEQLSKATGGLYAEKWAPFTKELAVMVVRAGETTVSYPTVETVHKNSVCHTVFAPARQVPLDVQNAAQELARKAVSTFDDSGVYGVEMFLLPDNSLKVNEIAPRPHNSGHYTQDACVTSQFEAHVRACMGLPLPTGCTDFATPETCAIMLNVLGNADATELNACSRALSVPGCAVHLYGKSTRPGRKLGHINIVGASMAECETKLAYIEHGTPLGAPTPQVGVIMGSDSDLPTMKAACKILEDFGVPFEVSIVSAHRTPRKMVEYAESAESRGLRAIIAGAGGAAHLPGMVAASTVLPVIGVPVKGSSLDGVDSLHSIVQMPRGVPVATVAINNSTNAALLAIRILGAADAKYRGLLADFQKRSLEEVYAKDAHLAEVGHKEYSWPAK